MNPLRQVLLDYLAVRRALGFNLKTSEKLLAQFVTYVEERKERHLCLTTMLAWATLPADAHPSWLSYRLSVVRGFASHVHALDPATEVPPTDLLPWRRCRATPYLYSDDEVAALMAVTASLQTPHRVMTYRTLIGLLAVTGMRVGEAIALDREDIDATQGVLTIRMTKFGKSREVPVHPSTGRGPASLSPASRPASCGGEHPRGVRLHRRDSIVVRQCPVDVPPVGAPYRAHTPIGGVPSQAPRFPPRLRDPYHA